MKHFYICLKQVLDILGSVYTWDLNCNCFSRAGSVRPNPEGRINKNRKAKNKKKQMAEQKGPL